MAQEIDSKNNTATVIEIILRTTSEYQKCFRCLGLHKGQIYSTRSQTQRPANSPCLLSILVPTKIIVSTADNAKLSLATSPQLWRNPYTHPPYSGFQSSHEWLWSHSRRLHTMDDWREIVEPRSHASEAFNFNDYLQCDSLATLTHASCARTHANMHRTCIPQRVLASLVDSGKLSNACHHAAWRF